MEEFNSDALIEITFNGVEQRIGKDRAALYTHVGGLACFDHVYMIVEDDPQAYVDDEEEALENAPVIRIFRHAPEFDILAGFMVANQFQLHLNLPNVANCDREAYEAELASEGYAQLVDEEVTRAAAALPETVFIPDGWGL